MLERTIKKIAIKEEMVPEQVPVVFRVILKANDMLGRCHWGTGCSNSVTRFVQHCSWVSRNLVFNSFSTDSQFLQ